MSCGLKTILFLHFEGFIGLSSDDFILHAKYWQNQKRLNLKIISDHLMSHKASMLGVAFLLVMAASALAFAQMTPDSSLKQLRMGVDPHDIECRVGQMLVFKASNWQPACINTSSYQALHERNWIADHDPSHADLMGMKEEYLSKNPPVIKEEPKVPEQPEEPVVENATDNEPKNYTIELREEMNMGAQ
jgi:hypothetical protein